MTTVGDSATADQAIGIIFDVGTLAAGDSKKFSYQTFLGGESDFAAPAAPAAPAASCGGGESGSVSAPIVDNTPIDPAPAGTNIQPTDEDGDGLR